MTWGDLGWAAVAVVGLFGSMGLLIWLCQEVFALRIAAATCVSCGRRLGRRAARTGVRYYERLYGPGVRVMGGPWRYRDARVVTCPGCGAEVVFGTLCGFIGRFAPDRDTPD